MSAPLRFALAVVLALSHAEISVSLIGPPWGYVVALVGGFALGFLMARAK